MDGGIFISYRREDSRASSGRLYETLRSAFGSERLFIDVDDVPLGSDFRAAVAGAIAESAAMVVVIGPRWATGASGAGSRLDRPGDFVRMEIEQALVANLPVFPVLVDGAAMPASDQLPTELEAIAFRNAASLDHDSWDRDVDPLLAALTQLLEGSRERSRLTRRRASAGRGDAGAIDPASRMVVDTVEVGESPSSPVGAEGLVWVPNQGSGTVSVIG